MEHPVLWAPSQKMPQKGRNSKITKVLTNAMEIRRTPEAATQKKGKKGGQAACQKSNRVNQQKSQFGVPRCHPDNVPSL